jgi:hypothetical protein
MPVLGQQEQTTFRPRPCHDPKTGVKSPGVSPLSIARLVPWAAAGNARGGDFATLTPSLARTSSNALVHPEDRAGLSNSKCC